MSLPIIIIENFSDISESDKTIMIDDIDYSRERALDEDKNSYKTNVEVRRDSSGKFDLLYKKFLKKSIEIFGNLELSHENRKTCYAFCTNNEYWSFNPHIHNCMINSVYYLNVPKHNDSFCGPIMFTNDIDEGKWEYYQPKNNDLIIFPGNLYHDPNFVPTKEWRISINMEIRCKNDIRWSDYK